jgi:hypothetical protein
MILSFKNPVRRLFYFNTKNEAYRNKKTKLIQIGKLKLNH